MTTHDESNDQRGADTREGGDGSRRLFILVGLLALALFALWYDYKVARPAVEQAYEQVTLKNSDVNATADFHRMTSVDVQQTLNRAPSETFLHGKFTVEAYRWSAGMPIEVRGLSGDKSPGIGLKTHAYYAVYRKEGPDLAFVTHFKFDLDHDYFTESEAVVGTASTDLDGSMAMGMEDDREGAGMGSGGMGSGSGGPSGGFDPETIFAERDADGDGKLSGDEISERMREGLEATDTDGDGSVSKEEFLARMSRFRGRGERGGPGGEGGGRGSGEGAEGEGETRRQRPPLESSDESSSTQATPNEPVAADEAKDFPSLSPAESTSDSPSGASPETSEDAPKEVNDNES